MSGGSYKESFFTIPEPEGQITCLTPTDRPPILTSVSFSHTLGIIMYVHVLALSPWVFFWECVGQASQFKGHGSAATAGA